MRKKTVRTFLSLAFAISLFASVCAPALAGLTTSYLSYPTNNYSWSPSISNVLVDSDNGKLRVISYFYWNSSNVNTVFNIPLGWYYTIEHHCGENGITDGDGMATDDDLYTNIPYAHPDLDDDDGDGYTEELEMTCNSNSNSTPFLSSVNYFFDTTWHNTTRGRQAMNCSVISQQSQYAPLSGEFNARASEYHGYTPYFDVLAEGRASIENPREPVSKAVTVQATSNGIVISPTVATSADATRVMNQQWDCIIKETSNERAQDLLENATAVVTFAEPIDNDTLNSILQSADATLQCCAIKYIDSNESRITGWTSDISDEHLQEKLDYLTGAHEGVSYAGIVSANITLDLTSNAYSQLKCEDCVYFVDLSEPIERLNNEDYSQDLNIKVLDASWTLEFSTN